MDVRPLIALSLLGGCVATAPPPIPVASVAPTTTAATARPAPPAAPDPSFADFHLQCRDQLAPCPAAMGMLLRREGEQVERCTASLVAPDTVVTASHCLPPHARAPGALCDDSWVLFTRTADRPAEWAACDRVIGADDVRDDRVMRSDVALLRLRAPVDRPTLPVRARSPDDQTIVTVLSARAHPIYPEHNELVVRRCRVATRDSARETFGERADRVGWLVECPSYPGNSGSPVLDAAGRLRSVMHAGSAPAAGVAVTSDLATNRAVGRATAPPRP